MQEESFGSSRARLADVVCVGLGEDQLAQSTHHAQSVERGEQETETEEKRRILKQTGFVRLRGTFPSPSSSAFSETRQRMTLGLTFDAKLYSAQR